MELFSAAGLLGAVIGAVLGAANYVMLISALEGRIREAGKGQPAEELEGKVALVRRSILAFDLLVFIGVGYWVGRFLGG